MTAAFGDPGPPHVYRVYMHFAFRPSPQGENYWYIHFKEPGLQVTLPRRLRFVSEGKVLEVARNGGGLPDLAARQAIDQGLRMGRGALWLHLTGHQYRALTTGPAAPSSPPAQAGAPS